MFKRGFTLAEILVTLTIIGVIASMTIPALVQNTQDQQLRTAWKNDYGILDQAVRRVSYNNAGSLKNLCVNDDNDCLRNKLLNYLSYVKKCNSPTSNGNCWHNLGDWKFLNGTTGTDLNPVSGAILSNGALLWIWNADSTCTNSTYRCGLISVDVNGFKGPNTAGRDIYQIRVTEVGIQPAGSTGFGYEPNCRPTGEGFDCSSLYLHQ